MAAESRWADDVVLAQSGAVAIAAHDGTPLTLVVHRPFSLRNSAADVLVVLPRAGGAAAMDLHGLVNGVHELGMDVVVLGVRGTGLSGGPRGDVSDTEVALVDVLTMLDAVKKRGHPGMLLLGHASGCALLVHALAAMTAAGDVDHVRGVMLVNPSVRFGPRRKPGLLRRAAFAFNSTFRSTARVVRLWPESRLHEINHVPDREEAELREVDDSVVSVFTVRFAKVMSTLAETSVHAARSCHLPLLLLAGVEDQLSTGARDIFDAWGAHNKRWIDVQGAGHGSQCVNMAAGPITDWMLEQNRNLVRIGADEMHACDRGAFDDDDTYSYSSDEAGADGDASLSHEFSSYTDES